jgi:hypothetical protein
MRLCRCKIPTPRDGYPQKRKITWRDMVVFDRNPIRLARQRKAAFADVMREGRIFGLRNGGHARKAMKLLSESPHELRRVRLIVSLLP